MIFPSPLHNLIFFPNRLDQLEYGTLYITAARSTEQLQQFAELPHVRAIDLFLEPQDHHTDRDICQLLASSGDLFRVLDLNYTTFSGDGLVGLNLKFNKLTKLNLSSCKHLTDKGLREVLRASGPNLKVLQLYSTDITGEGLMGLDMEFTKLGILNLGACSYLADEGLLELLRLCGPHLTALNLYSTDITGEGVAALDVKFTKLETLHVDCCEYLTDQGLCELLDICGLQLQEPVVYKVKYKWIFFPNYDIILPHSHEIPFDKLPSKGK